MANFHKMLFEHKVIEALELLASLGATFVEIEQIAGESSATEIANQIAVPGAPVGGGLTAGKQVRQSGEILYSVRLNPLEQPTFPQV